MTRFQKRLNRISESLNSVTINTAKVSTHSIPNVGVTISHTLKQVLIRDLDCQQRDILVQGDDMQKFLSELSDATKQMPDVPIKDALVILTATHVANNWS